MKKVIIPCFVLLSVLCIFSCKSRQQQGEEHFKKGSDFLFAGDMENAKKEYTLSTAADSSYWKAYYELGAIQQIEGDFSNAYANLSKVIKLNPGFAMAWYNRASTAEMMGDEKGYNTDLNKAIELNKDLFTAVLSKGRAAYSRGDMKETIKDLTDAINIRADYYAVYSMRGTCRFKMGDTAGAISDFDMEIKLAPGRIMGYVNKAVLYGEQSNFKAALESINQGLTIDPMASQAYIYRGMYEIKLNQKDQACKDFNVAQGLKNPEAAAYIKEYCK